MNVFLGCLVVPVMRSTTKSPIVLALAAFAIAALAGCSSTTSATGPAKIPPAGAKTASISIGKIIVDAAGHTAYFFDSDTAGSGKSACTGGCAATWPAIVSTSPSPTISGVRGTVGTIPDGSGSYQITVNGMPIYDYSGDRSAGDTNGQGIGGTWWIAGATGKELRKGASHGGY